MRTRGPLQVVRRRWRSIVVVTLLALLMGLAYTQTATVTYRASASAFFSLTTGSSAADLVQGSTYAQNQVESFAQLATTPAVLQPVVDQLGLDVSARQLAGQVQAQVPVGTVIVDVTVTDASARESARLANAVVASLSTVVEGIAPKDGDGKPTVVGTTVAPAAVPDAPSSPDVPVSLAAAVVVGLLAGLALAWAGEAADTRVRDAEVLAEVTDRPLIGSIGAWATKGQHQVVVAAAPHSSPAEGFRQLRTNLQFLQVAEEGVGGAYVVSITSSVAGEGKSTVASNLAVTLAETGARVLLVDADIRRPTIARLLGLEGGVGLTTVLAGQAALEDVVQEWGEQGLAVLPSGAVPPNPAELLGSPAMRRLVALMRTSYEYVVVDTAPLLPVADATVLSRVVDGTVVVAQAGRVRRAQVGQALANLEQVSARVLGVVLNRVRRDNDLYAYEREEAPAPKTPIGPGAASARGRSSDRGGSLPLGR
ncbi:MAG: capsular exopolysaccharide family [Frankiales bacterium]|nr:capsular exopolysaccharide family [Frankiales bacterium]